MKKFVFVLLTIAVSLSALTACGMEITEEEKEMYECSADVGRMVEIEEHPYLYYDYSTHIVYIIQLDENIGNYKAAGFMSPYYSENGKLCRYENGNLMEIVN